jgi:hypothetical protein
MMDLAEATVTMSYLLLYEKRFHDRHAEMLKDERDKKVYEEAMTHIKSNTAEFGSRLAAMPQFFDILESWLVTVVGKQGISPESMDEAVKTNDHDNMLERTGALAISVRDYFRSQDFVIRNIGAGEDGWDMCVRCTEKKSKSLCFDLHQRFQKAISLNLMSISRRFGGHYLPGLYTWEDAERMLKLYGRDPNVLEIA